MTETTEDPTDAFVKYTAREQVHKALQLREAAQVERFHATPHLRPYPVGLHCYGMLTLLHMLYPRARAELMWAIIFHDTPERWVGDLPSPTKSDPLLKERLDRMEAHIDEVLGLQFSLDDDEKCVLKALDWLECYLYCHDELNMGNQNMNGALTYMKDSLINGDWVPKPVCEFVTNYYWKRTSDHGPD